MMQLLQTGGVAFWPEAISAHAEQVDALAISFFALVMALAAPIGFALIWFAWRYRRFSKADRKQPHHGLRGRSRLKGQRRVVCSCIFVELEVKRAGRIKQCSVSVN